MSSAASKTYLTPEQYLEIERKSEIKHEYYRGEMFAMAGASREHNLIALNLGSELRNQLRQRACEAYVGEMRVLIDETGLYAYPDVVVVCDEPQFLDAEVDTLLNPTAIIEVLSPSTEDYDLGKKFRHYRRIPSLKEYVVAAQDRVWIEHHRLVDGEWKLREYFHFADVLRLDSVRCELSLIEIYAKVSVEEGRETRLPGEAD